MYTLLIDVPQLLALQASGADVRVFDASFDLARPQAADEAFAQVRIRGARQAHLERDLSAHGDRPAVNGGRHPLPTRESVVAWLGKQGVGPETQVVVYDRNQGMQCGRLWWMLQWVGHPAAAVLDGGLAAWQAAGGPTEQGPLAPVAARELTLRPPLRELVLIEAVQAGLGDPAQVMVDARAAPRYRGEIEPLDPVAGHIPGALNRPFGDNFEADGRYKSAAQLRAEWSALLAGRPAAHVVHQCGSGVSAIPNLIAMEVAGLGPTRLYAGSWSEWCRTPGLPCARG